MHGRDGMLLRREVSALVGNLLASETDDDDDELELEQRFWERAVSSFKENYRRLRVHRGSEDGDLFQGTTGRGSI